MSRSRWVVLASALLLSSGVAAQGLTADEQAVVRKAADQFLSALEKNAWFDVTADEVLARIKSGKQDFVILDVRVPKDKKFDRGHLPGAMFVAAWDAAKPDNLAKLPKDKDIIVHCDTGQQQNKVVAALRMMGYRAYAMRFGYMSWSPAPPTGITLEAISASYSKSYPVEK